MDKRIGHYDDFLKLYESTKVIDSRNSRIQKSRIRDKQGKSERVLFQYDISVSTEKHQIILDNMKTWRKIIKSEQVANLDEIEQIFIKSEPDESPSLCMRSYYLISPHSDLKSVTAYRSEKSLPFIPISKIKEWFIDLIFCLDWIHEKGLIHRNINTTSVFLTPNETLLLTQPGFGFDEMIDFLDDIDLFVDPEVFEKKKFGPSSDIFSVGALFRSILSKFDEFGDILEEYSSENDFIGLIERMCCEDSEERPENTKEIIKQIQRMFPELYKIRMKKEHIKKKEESAADEEEEGEEDKHDEDDDELLGAKERSRKRIERNENISQKVREIDELIATEKQKIRKLKLIEESLQEGILEPPEDEEEPHRSPRSFLPPKELQDLKSIQKRTFSSEKEVAKIKSQLKELSTNEELEKKNEIIRIRLNKKIEEENSKIEMMEEKEQILGTRIQQLFRQKVEELKDLKKSEFVLQSLIDDRKKEFERLYGREIERRMEFPSRTRHVREAKRLDARGSRRFLFLFFFCVFVVCIPCLSFYISFMIVKKCFKSTRFRRTKKNENQLIEVKKVVEEEQQKKLEKEGKKEEVKKAPEYNTQIVQVQIPAKKMELQQNGMIRKKMYTVKDLLGQGAQSCVYLVEKDGILCTMKRFKVGTVPEFEAESKALKTLLRNQDEKTNRFVVRFIEEFGYQDRHGEDHRFIIMEYCEQGDLQKFIREKTKRQKRSEKRLDSKLIFNLIRDLSKGVLEVHSSGFVHHDLKSPNIFLTKDGSVRIGDFGFATKVRKEENNGSVEGLDDDEDVFTGGGTWKYMSPEAAKNGVIGYKSLDIWSLSTLFVELICCRVMDFKLKSEEERREFVFEKLWVKDLRLKRLIMRGLLDEASKRIGAEELVVEVEKILSGGEIVE